MIDTQTIEEGATRSSDVARRRLVAALVATAAGVIIVLLMPGRPVVRSDEAWLVWVTERMRHGDVLYRDVYFVSTPLGAWVATAASAIGGVSIQTMRVVSVGIFVASAAIVWWTAHRVKLGLVGRLMLLAALFAYASPVAHFASIYSALAILFSLLAFAALVVWLDPNRSRSNPVPQALSVAGVAVGLSIASKPNTGALTLAAVVVTLLMHDRSQLREAARNIRTVAVPTLLVVVTVLIAIAATGGLGAFVGDVFVEKNDYVQVMNRSLLPGFRSVFDILPGHGTSLVHRPAAPGGRAVLVYTETLGSRYFETFRLVPFSALGVLAWAAFRARRARDGRIFLCVAFFIAGWASAFPAPGPQHLTEVVPLLLAATGTAVGIARRVPRAARQPAQPSGLLCAVAALWLVFGCIVIAARAVEDLPGDGSPASTLSQMQGPAIGSRSQIAITRNVRTLRSLTGGTVFIVRADAAFYYLAGNLRNPTPYDFAARSDFGAHGEEGVVDLFDHHRVRFACISTERAPLPSDFPDFRPLEVNRVVRERFSYIARLPLCTLYEDPLWVDATTRTAACTVSGGEHALHAGGKPRHSGCR